MQQYCTQLQNKYDIAGKLIFIFILSISVLIIGFSVNPKVKEYSIVGTPNYKVHQNAQTYCADYNKCFWSCCSKHKNITTCPSISMYQPNEDSDNECYVNDEKTHIIGSICSPLEKDSFVQDDSIQFNDSNPLNNHFRCCQGGMCVRTEHFWTVSCEYLLRSDNKHEITVKISATNLFLTRTIASNSLTCSENNGKLLYYPTEDYEFLISIPQSVYYPQKVYNSDIIYDEKIVFNSIGYDDNSKKHYEGIKSGNKAGLIIGILLLVITLALYFVYCLCRFCDAQQQQNHSLILEESPVIVSPPIYNSDRNN